MTRASQADKTLLAASDGQEEEARQILTFRLGGTVCAVDVRHVREVLDFTKIAPIPSAPANLIGIIDVRGTGVPVVDLKRKLRMIGGENETTSETRIVVLEIGPDTTRKVIAIVADAVHEVVEYDGETMEEPPQFGESWDASFMHGLGRREREFLTFLDIDAVFCGDRHLLADTLAA
ncbi:chemotaxis protein CheW [Fulvimarina sp. 2208YS6-2-32]|uniref:Chemotaxis protein CheW n=1 Tax=Fulvimarina uroteuthidis TaxID=3098149 RepID=A0ABU5HYF8_9HYPH|nr:chemotaxis protein CheW [Fulvimarina sp. 2208YS6-2-32]MDY8107619.1 chemotaxis protein CheW [Fulvimarina sp. 2208YS6-2-32]